MTDFNRNIFTDTKPSHLLDYALAIGIGLCLALAALAWFDVLFA